MPTSRNLLLLACDHRTSFVRLFGDRGADASLLRAAKNLVGRAGRLGYADMGTSYLMAINPREED